jgi:hypothetical protein
MSKRSGRGWVVVVLALVLLGVVAGGGVYLLLRPAEPGSVRLTTQPADVVVVFDEDSIPARSSPFVIANVEPDIMHLLEVHKDGYQTWSMQVTVEPGEMRQLPPVTLEPLAASEPAAAEEVAVADTEQAEADVGLDTNGEGLAAEEVEPEDPRAATPTTRTRRQAARRRRARRNRRSADALAAAEEPADSEPEPEPAPAPEPEREHQPPPGMGVLHVQSRPWSQVHVDGRLVGSTPQRNIDLPAGRHRLVLINPEFNIRQALDVNIRAGQVTNRSVTLRPGE